ncbi:MAG: FAD-dependent oxidoreductase [Deltaproteobacteria bacterium]|nr:FAD-dependent oxidoreductase [Deltaproteobacteria bacterium]
MQPTIAVIGGGIAGLASAYYLTRHGYRPLLLEAGAQLGGLGAHFDHDGVALDRWYHVILDSDAELCGLIGELGLGQDLVWRETGMGFHLGGRLYGFNSPLDVLRFAALPMVDRLRTGVGALYLTRGVRDPLALDDIAAVEWLPRVFGARVFERIWQPLLRAKFGDRAAEVPAYWVWNTLSREKNGGQEVKGYLRGGYAALVAALRAAVLQGGGEIRLNAPVRAIEASAAGVTLEVGDARLQADAAVATLPLPVLARVARGALAAQVPLPALHYQGVVNAVVMARRRLERFYWTIVVDPRFAFQGVVETTHVIPNAWVGGRHLVYAMNYCAADSPLYARDDDTVARQAVDGLCALYPHFRPADVEGVRVFRAPYVEPVWTRGYLRQRPAPRVADHPLYLATTAQAYPRVTAWNTSVALARECVAALHADRAAAPPRSAAA